MKMVEVGKVTLKEAGERIGVSYGQAKRIGRSIRERGIKGLVRGNRVRPSDHHIAIVSRQFHLIETSSRTYLFLPELFKAIFQTVMPDFK